MQTQLKSKQYVVEKGGNLNSSTYADVYLATCAQTGSRVVVKRLTKLPPTGITNEEINKMILREQNLIEKAQESKNPYIVKLLDSFEENNRVYLVMKNYLQKDLAKYLKEKGGKLSEEAALELFRKICHGYNWWVVNEIVHRDIKLLNVLMEDDQPALCDFGSSRPICEENSVLMSQKPFSGFNLSPEQIRDEPYGSEVDIWALGLILYELIYGVHPFVKKVKDTENNILFEECSFDETIKVSYECKSLILKMLEKNKETRINWEALITHPLIRSSNKAFEDVRSVIIRKVRDDDHPTIPKEQLNDLYHSTITLIQAIRAIKTAQHLVSEHCHTNFLPFSTFLIFTYGLVKISIINLRFALSFTTLSTNNQKFKDIFDRCKTLKTALEEIYYSEDFMKFQNGFPELSLSFRNKVFSPLTNKLEIDYKYIEQFKDWISNESGQLVIQEAWKQRGILKAEGGLVSKCIYDVVAILEDNLIHKITNPEVKVQKYEEQEGYAAPHANPIYPKSGTPRVSKMKILSVGPL